MFKKRAVRVQTTRKRETSNDPEGSPLADSANDTKSDGEDKVDLQELLELRKLQRAHQGIDINKLNQGDNKKKRKAKEEDEAGPSAPTYGLQSRPSKKEEGLEEDEDPEDEESKTRKLVRSNNFTQQTNALDVDKHMMAYIEEGIRKRRGDAPLDSDDTSRQEQAYDPHEELFRIDERYRIKKKTLEEDGNVTNSVSMLTAIPEVDLGMDVRLKNIEETEKAKRAVVEERRAKLAGSTLPSDEADLAATRFFRPNHTVHSDSQALKIAKLEAQGLTVDDVSLEPPARMQQRREMATDDQVMERFKKRMRK